MRQHQVCNAGMTKNNEIDSRDEAAGRLAEMQKEEQEQAAEDYRKKLAFSASVLRSMTVCEALLLNRRFFKAAVRLVDGDAGALDAYGPDTPPVRADARQSLEYTEARVAVIRDILLDVKGECSLRGVCNAVDLLRGHAILALHHPVEPARQLHASLATGLSLALQTRVGVPVTVDAELNDLSCARRTLALWQATGALATQHLAARKPSRIVTVGSANVSDARTKIAQSVLGESMMDLGVLIVRVGRSADEPSQ